LPIVAKEKLAEKSEPIRGNHLRVMKAVLFLALAPTFGLLSFESLSKLWGYQDSPSWIYITYGTVAGLLAVVCLALAVKSLRQRRRH
jgi:hypothetical protein